MLTEYPKSKVNIIEMDLLAEFKNRGALLEGHFILSSGLHSNKYLQSALLLKDPKMAEELGVSIAKKFPDDVDVVLSPALGGLIIGHEVARAKKCTALFSEKDSEGHPVLRRGFKLEPHNKVLVVEDVVTTGLSTRDVLGLVEKAGAVAVGLGAIVNRSGQSLTKLFPGVNAISLLDISVETWEADAIPDHLNDISPLKPGSRKK